jgi:pyrroloquinoline quinone (PQQ) biosynthesis protein C
MENIFEKNKKKANNTLLAKFLDRIEDETRKPCNIWWSSLSINEQNKYISKHPFFSKMGRDYFGAHKTSIEQLYEYFN